MKLTRVLEPELMDTADDARDYDAMDHSAVNIIFVDDFLAAGFVEGDVLDLGTGTALIPIELCRRINTCRVMAADAAVAMLNLGRLNVEVAGLMDRIMLTHIDAKQLPYKDGSFAAVMSNSIVHHIPEPITVLRDAVRVTAARGLLFFRDLLRPNDDVTVGHLVETYAAEANEHQRALFEASLRAALDLNEVRALIQTLGFDPTTVQQTSDRHWTWSVQKA